MGKVPSVKDSCGAIQPILDFFISSLKESDGATLIIFCKIFAMNMGASFVEMLSRPRTPSN